MLSGQPRTEVVLFEAGFPDADVTWTLKDPSGLMLAAGSVTPSSGSVSVPISLDGADNNLSGGEVISWRDLSWSYLSGGSTISGYLRYHVEALLPFGVSSTGVRRKLGIDAPSDLPDSDIGLPRAYLLFQDLVTTAALTAAEAGSQLQQLKVREAIEAMAALDLIPTMQVRLAKSETSGTNTYARQDVDWNVIAERLEGTVSEGATAVAGAGAVAEGGRLFILSTPTVDLFPDG